MVTSNIYAKMQSTSNTITGNAVAQRRLDNKMAYLNEGLGLVGTLGVGAIIGLGLGTAAWFISKIWYAGVQFITRKRNQSSTMANRINRQCGEIK